jgi:prepilin-type N-terminal cleavage/methylation domain-containing protein
MIKRHNGFTIVEILTAIMIIAIVAAFAVPRYQTVVEKARSAEAVQTMIIIRNAKEVYRKEHSGAEPTLLSQLDVTLSAPDNFDAPVLGNSTATPPNEVSMQRKDGSYKIYMGYTGAFQCQGLAGSGTNMCRQMGYTVYP